jgi:hypothetical protein
LNGAKCLSGQFRKYARAMAMATDVVAARPKPQTVETTTTPSR